MCWRWEVSLVSASLEVCCLAFLWRRNHDLYDKRFALFILAIATMESCQGLLWFFALPEDNWSNVFFSACVVFSAWIQVPFAVVNFVVGNEDVEHDTYRKVEVEASVIELGAANGPPPGSTSMPPGTKVDAPCEYKCFKRRPFVRWFSFRYFVVQYLFVLALQTWSGTWHTKVGPNGHQIWPCAAVLHEAASQFGGIGMHEKTKHSKDLRRNERPAHATGQTHQAQVPLDGLEVSALNGCTIACSLYMGVLGFTLVFGGVGLVEWLGFCVIGHLSFSYTFWTLNSTMEACSVWCWSAGAHGLWFLVRVPLCRRRK